MLNHHPSVIFVDWVIGKASEFSIKVWFADTILAPLLSVI